MHVFIRMEEASQTTLFKMIRSGSMAVARAKRFQAQLSDAVAHCHAQGVAHRDLKPENIALDATGTSIKVLDFGCSIQVGSWRSDVVGSFPFMSPEILIASAEAPYIAAPVDVWACAVILMEVLFGLHHFTRSLGWERVTKPGPKRHAELLEYFGDAAAVQKLLEPWCGEEERSDLEDMLRGMFRVIPSRRWSARRMSASSWLHGASRS